METSLEGSRFVAKFNMGESGGRPRSLRSLIEGLGLDLRAAQDTLLDLTLNDSPNWGHENLREAIAAIHPGAAPSNVLVTTGTSEALFLLFRQLQPRKLALPMPAFQLLYEIPLSLGAQIVPLPVRWDHKNAPYLNEQEWLDVLRQESPDVIVINHPHNPSGMNISKQMLAEIIKVATEIGAIIVADEHYRFLSSDDSLLGETLYAAGNKNIFITGSFIKCLGTPGLRIGWCVGCPEVLSRMQNEKNYITHTVNPISEWIAQAILSRLDSELISEMRHEWKENKKLLQEFLASSKWFRGSAPSGGLVTSIGLSEFCVQKNFDDVDSILAKSGVFVLPLQTMEFGQRNAELKRTPLEMGVGFRLGLGLLPSKFKKALMTMEDAMHVFGRPQ
jgi:aspartate/methionine/tyrosine aminotransferase